MISFRSGTVLPPPTAETIKEFEATHRVRMPTDFWTFIRSYNGCVPVQNRFFEGQHERLVERFLCVLGSNEYKSDPAGIYDIGVVASQIEERLVDDPDMLGLNVIPFAVLFGGDFVCLDLRDPARPAVAVWDHERSDEFRPHLTPVARSVSEFVAMLRA